MSTLLASQTRRHVAAKRSRTWRIIVGVIIGIILAVLPILMTPFVNFQITMIAVFAVGILGLNIVMGYAGQISLGQSFFLGFGAYIAAYGVKQEWPVPVIFIACCLIPAFVGWIIALPALRLHGVALAMVTISLPIVGTPLAKRLVEFTGGSSGMSASWMNAPAWTGLADDQYRYYVVLIIAAIFFLLAWNLVRGRIGRAFAIVKENEAVATTMGISSYRYKVMAFTIASLYGGVAGFLYLIPVQFTSPETMSFIIGINMLAALIVGGSASIIGSIIGGAFYILVPVLAGQIDSSQTPIIYAVALLLVLFLVPGGLVTIPRVIRRMIKRSGNTGVGPGTPIGGTTTPTTTDTAST